jgi:hypothetical protein
MKTYFLCAAIALLYAAPLFAEDSRRHIDPDEAYKNNCMRCHTSTQKYSPLMTETIVMHMRVRANLTQAEAEAILRYLLEDSGWSDRKTGETVRRSKRATMTGDPNVSNATGGRDK